MANNVGNISIGLSLDNQTFEAVLNGSASRLRRFESDVQRSGAAAAAAGGGVGQLSGSMRGLSSVMQSVSFGAGDFISQLGTRGFGGGLQAAANNIQQLGAAFGPMGLAVSAGVGVAATALGVWWEQSDRAAKKQKSLADENAAAWKRIAADSQKGAADWRQATRLAIGENQDIRENKGRKDLADLKGDFGSTDEKIAEMRRKRDALAKRFNETLPEELRNGAGPGGQFSQRAGVNLPGGFKSISEADSRTGPLFKRSMGAAINATVGKWVSGQAPGLAGWITGQKVKTFKNVPVLTPDKIDALGKIEREIIETNDSLENLKRRREAISKAIGPAFAEKRDKQIAEEAERIGKAEKKQSDKEAVLNQKAEEKRSKEIAASRDDFFKSIETPMEKFIRERQAIIDLNTSGAITADEAAKGIDRLRVGKQQPNELPNFAAGSQEVLSAINRVIRGGRESKVVEKNTGETVKEIKKQTGEIKSGFAKATRINVVRFN